MIFFFRTIKKSTGFVNYLPTRYYSIIEKLRSIYLLWSNSNLSGSKFTSVWSNSNAKWRSNTLLRSLSINQNIYDLMSKLCLTMAYSLGRYYMIKNILQEKISRLTSTSNLIGRYSTPMVGIHSCGEWFVVYKNRTKIIVYVCIIFTKQNPIYNFTIHKAGFCQ